MLEETIHDFESFSGIIDKAVETARKRDTIIRKKNYCKFFTREVMTARHEKIQQYKTFIIAKEKFRKGDLDNIILDENWKLFKIKRNKFVAVLRKAKKHYYVQQVNLAIHDGKKM